MGIHSVRAVQALTTEREVGHVATRLIAWMAAAVLDYENEHGHPPRVYYKGREDLAYGIGYRAPHNGSEAAHQAVKRALRELTNAGLIQCEEDGRGGRRSRYLLLIDPAPAEAQNRPKNVTPIGRNRPQTDDRRSLF